ncbi:hypothetical protein BDZ91DRAFT_780044 [Kalaharituber pfeilii]|nr:hypothetical protein BDZ91DRAFT_780044 [Kalaharituber pfeilii]
MVAYEPFRNAGAPGSQTAPTNPFASRDYSQNTGVSGRPNKPPQSYEEFRATGKSIELQDATDTRSLASTTATAPPPRGAITGLRARFPGKSTWAKVRLVLRIMSLLCSLATGLLVGAVLVTYHKTKGKRYRDEMLWPKNPMLVPTYYMLIAAIVTIIVHIGLIISHFYDRSRYYTEALTKRDKISSWIQFFLGITWVVGGLLARIYTYDKYGEGNDLWSWSCTSAWHVATRQNGVVKFWAVCIWLRSAYSTAYFNSMLEFFSIITFSINHCIARREGYQATPMH